MKNKKTFIFKKTPNKITINDKDLLKGRDFTWNKKTRTATLKTEDIFKCTKCKGKKVRKLGGGMICTKCEVEVDIPFELGWLIEKARLHAGFTQAKLAKKMKTKQSSIARAEKGVQEPSISFLQKVAKAVGTELILPKFQFEVDNMIPRRVLQTIPTTISETATVIVSPKGWTIYPKPKKK